MLNLNVKHALRQAREYRAVESNTIGERIFARRTELKLSQEALGSACGISKSAVHQWEKDETTISGPNLVACAQALKVTERWIITGRSPKFPAAHEYSTPSSNYPGLAEKSGGDEKREHRRQHFAAIGAVTAEWSQFLSDIDHFAAVLTEADREIIACFTSRLEGWRPKLEAYREIAKLRGVAAKTLKEIDQLSRDAAGLADERNRIAHDLWFFQFPDGEPYRVETIPKKRERPRVLPHPTKKIEELAERISGTQKKFLTIHDEVTQLLEK